MRHQDFEHRLVLLGASNLTRWFSRLVEWTGLTTTAPPCDVLVAMGHGRSYGITSRFLVRSLPGILDSQLWQALDDGVRLPTTALFTDIGNDLMYGVPVEQLVDWLARCVDRIEPHAQHIALSLPPVAHLPRMSKTRYYLARTLLFPGCCLSYDEALNRAERLHQGLKELASGRGLATVAQRSEWYGLDPIHPTAAGAFCLWQTLFRAAHWPYGTLVSKNRSPFVASWRWQSFNARPAQRWWLGLEQTTPQPSVRLASGTTISSF